MVMVPALVVKVNWACAAGMVNRKMPKKADQARFIFAREIPRGGAMPETLPHKLRLVKRRERRGSRLFSRECDRGGSGRRTGGLNVRHSSPLKNPPGGGTGPT